MRIDPRLIVEYATVAQEQSFTRAAAKLRIAQPWLSTRVRRLEEQVGFPLLIRNTRRVALTDRGEALLAAAAAVVDAAQRFDMLAAQLKREQSGRLRIGAPPYMKGVRERRDLIEQFGGTAPRPRIELETGWSLTLQTRLRDGEIDLAFVMGAYDASQFEGVKLRDCGLALFIPGDHRLAGRTSLDPVDLRGQAIRVFTRGLNPALWEEFYAPLMKLGAQIVEDHEMLEGPLDFAGLGDSIAAFFDFSSGLAPAPGIVRIPFGDRRPIPLFLLRRAGESRGDLVRFWDIARQVAAARRGAGAPCD